MVKIPVFETGLIFVTCSNHVCAIVFAFDSSKVAMMTVKNIGVSQKKSDTPRPISTKYLFF